MFSVLRISLLYCQEGRFFFHFFDKTNSNIALRVFCHFFYVALNVGHPRGTHSRYVIGCCLIPLGIYGLKNNSRLITYGIGCVWGMPFLSPLSSLELSQLSARTLCPNMLQYQSDIYDILIGRCPMSDSNFQHCIRMLHSNKFKKSFISTSVVVCPITTLFICLIIGKRIRQ